MNLLNKIFNIVFPGKCLLCNDSTGLNTENICSKCMDKIAFIKGSTCARCGIPFEVSYSLEDNLDYLWQRCRIFSPSFDMALSACRYDGVIKEIISAYKYQNKPYLGNDIISIMLRVVERGLVELSPELIIAVPLHVKRLRERGYDQAYILAEGIGRYLNIPVSCGNLTRIRYTVPQVNLSRDERIKNVKGAFSVKDTHELKGKRVFLIDDVFTTGATIEECVKIIRDAGAEKIYVVTVARA